MCIRKNLPNLRLIRKRQAGLVVIMLSVCLLALTLISSRVTDGKGIIAHASSDSLPSTKKLTNVKPGAFIVSSNRSSIKIENGVPKLSINGKIINNMFGIYVYCTGVDPQTNQFLVEMKEIIDRTSNLDIPIMSFDPRLRNRGISFESCG